VAFFCWQEWPVSICSHELVQTALYKKVIVFPVPSPDVINRTLPGRELLNYSWPGRVRLVTSRLGMGKMITYFTVCCYSCRCCYNQQDFPGRKIKCPFLVMVNKALFNTVKLPIVNCLQKFGHQAITFRNSPTTEHSSG
jgi:hypothetical protein